MRKKDLRRRRSFHVYFIVFATIIISISTTIPTVIYGIINAVTEKSIVVPEIILVSLTGFLVGITLSFFTGRILLAPIKKLELSMEEVANGNFDIQLEEHSSFKEVEDMYHYFNLMVKELKATETIQSDFISNASHEFKTPLSVIEGYTTLLADKNITLEERKLYTDKILFNLNRMNQLVHNILLLSKVDNHSISKQKNSYLLDEQIRQSILFFETKWSEKNIELDVNLDSISYYGNETLMIHVWNNLISNAIKFTPNHGVIRLSLIKEENQIIFTIEDNGPGVSDESIKYIFNKFYQSDTSHKEEGYGLGLSLVKRIVDLDGGKVEVNNLSPNGCQFKVYLPNLSNKN